MYCVHLFDNEDAEHIGISTSNSFIRSNRQPELALMRLELAFITIKRKEKSFLRTNK